MARTYRDLWPSFLDWDNWLCAYRRCRRRKRYKRPASEFDFDWESALVRLRRDLADGVYRPGSYRHFRIQEPKPRLISAAPFRDRVVHHALVNILEPIFERRFLNVSFACRRGYGTHRAIARAQQHLRRHPWFLKTDIVKFFPSIDHECLLRTVRRVVTDGDILALLELLLATGVEALPEAPPRHYFPGDDLFAVLRPRGLPIGNLTSQFLANVFLDPVDHIIKEELRVPGYVRYCDDLLLFGDSKTALWEVADVLRDRLQEIRLRMHPDKTQVAPSRGGVNFLGFRVLPRGLKMTQQGVRRFVRRRRRHQKLFAAGELRAHEVTRSVAAWLAHAGRACAPGLRRALMAQSTLSRRRKSPPDSGPSQPHTTPPAPEQPVEPQPHPVSPPAISEQPPGGQPASQPGGA